MQLACCAFMQTGLRGREDQIQDFFVHNTWVLSDQVNVISGLGVHILPLLSVLALLIGPLCPGTKASG